MHRTFSGFLNQLLLSDQWHSGRAQQRRFTSSCDYYVVWNTHASTSKHSKPVLSVYPQQYTAKAGHPCLSAYSSKTMPEAGLDNHNSAAQWSYAMQIFLPTHTKGSCPRASTCTYETSMHALLLLRHMYRSKDLPREWGRTTNSRARLKKDKKTTAEST